jgi:cobalt/nickel transport system permease protein
MDARAKLSGLLLFLIIVVTTPPQYRLVFLVCGCLLLLLLVVAKTPLPFLLKRAAIFLPILLMVLFAAAFAHTQGADMTFQLQDGTSRTIPFRALRLWSIFSKAGLGFLCAILLNTTTPFSEILQGLARLRVPALLITLTAFVYRYCFVIAEEARRMKHALYARGFRPRWLSQARILGLVIGALFLRSHARAERTYLAMCARGYTGTTTTINALPLCAIDYLFLLGIPLLAVIIRGIAR